MFKRTAIKLLSRPGGVLGTDRLFGQDDFHPRRASIGAPAVRYSSCIRDRSATPQVSLVMPNFTQCMHRYPQHGPADVLTDRQRHVCLNVKVNPVPVEVILLVATCRTEPLETRWFPTGAVAASVRVPTFTLENTRFVKEGTASSALELS